ncbi:MAG: 50S ribosomal protein L31 [Candidatus Uhrbacteria bacterium GW2011_GWF2_41_16]|uniref:50S ribosomal protein L31 n=2 Tax=Candidatus Uhriibacteriota TaxID=1752732 RepID=A0A0G0VGI4_9BACT|nr:MAG: 50S ribosomal protein L31 [Candidatus Uhrbacteria bacterium GW2011_GWA2_41_10]KKR87807.1 MAG: 50S ribosomal protein L31 [Candidatus Uhrbacteria bacterium GW2011_GWC2_41_11]KKR98746.1 MAG: 50S ribosomal protein L31 [Candidatus Uhrbacteria bacterium GW2011_GWF2_41_16]HBP00136.1 50S ribosomal protein L31 [Candidatus Uhrbacteria bacterium]
MQKTIHPEYFENAKIVCACGALYDVGSTVKEIHVELCAACHPFYTGEKQKMLDTARRVEKFVARMGRKETAGVGNKKEKQEKRAARKASKKADAGTEKA